MDIVTERKLTIEGPDGHLDAFVRVSRPVPDESGEDWVCDYEVCIAGDCSSHRTIGIDSMQALQLAIRTLDVEIRHKAKKYGGNITFLDEPFISVLEGGFGVEYK